MKELKIIDEGVKDYEEMLAKQRAFFSEMVELKKSDKAIEEEYLFLVEHNPVVTMGKHAKDDNILMPEDLLKAKGVGVYRIERGGDVTYHGPGQLVVYPLLDLESHHLGVKDYVCLLEETVIRTIGEYGVRGERIAGASGVWIGVGTATERKICALGVKCSRYITMHGLALNVNTDLSGFRMINPCGFVDKGVTSLSQELGAPVEMDSVKSILTKHFKLLLENNYRMDT